MVGVRGASWVGMQDCWCNERWYVVCGMWDEEWGMGTQYSIQYIKRKVPVPGGAGTFLICGRKSRRSPR